MALYHQFHAVNVALQETLRATVLAGGLAGGRTMREEGGRYFAGPMRDAAPGDRRVGVVWHTQGSGKSLTMAFYAGRVILHPQMENPTLVVITDRNDLDNQLFGTFARCQELLRQPPVQAESRADLRQKLRVDSGGVVFTTIQKFFPDVGATSNGSPPTSEMGATTGGSPYDRHPILSERRNIVVIADEAHRSQYDFIKGYAAHLRDALPNASFIGFTGTPIELSDKNTRAVFGDYISIYDIQRAVTDEATVPIYYESRLALIALDEAEKPRIDPDFEEITETEEVERRERLKSKWVQLEALVGAEKRVTLIAQDLVGHFEQRQETLEGKAMIVCMSRRICVALYHAIVALRPDWHHEDDDKGLIKIVMTGSAADPLEWQPHIRNKARRDELSKRFKDPADPFQIVIVRDMWLTGFDAPSLHTMYVDKPMRGHGLMQAIARVNRVFKDKPGGLVVDYLGLADELREALKTYTESGGQGDTAIDQQKAVQVMGEKYDICRNLFYGFDRSAWTAGTPQQRLSLLPTAQEHILRQRDGKERLLRAVTELSQAFALSVPHEETRRIRDDVSFFQAVRSAMAKGEEVQTNGRSPEAMEAAIRQLVSRAIVSDEVLDIFTAAGLKKPDISILDDQFLATVRAMPQQNLAVELLRKLLNNEIKTRSKRNVVQGRSFTAMLDDAIRRYQNRAVETAQIIEELIAMAKDMRQAAARGEELNLAEDELAFYDALEVNDSAVKVLGDETLQAIARELVSAVKRNVTIDWTMRENVRAQMRVLVKRILRKHGYPPDKQAKATQTVLEQAELLAGEWAIP
jgi:type I restriction enzyme R subunit